MSSRRGLASGIVAVVCVALVIFFADSAPLAAQAGPAPAVDNPAPANLPMVTRDADGLITIRALRLDAPLRIDGRLDEEVYGAVPAVSDFVQQEPKEGMPATEKTDVWVFFDSTNMYIAARCWDSHPERMIVNELRRDNRNLSNNDNFGVVLDTFYDHRNGFYFQTNPIGAMRDEQITERDANIDWNTIWDVKASRDDRGWVLEMVIPLKSLRYKAVGPQTWGINFRRIVPWKNEASFLSGIPASYGRRGIFKLSSAATIVGIEVPAQSRTFELKPYGKSGVTTNLRADPQQVNDIGADVGLDVKYGLTKGLIADFTVNTDFAQVEDDEQEVNLTRFDLFFPEKRDFFMEGQGIFSFGGVRTTGQRNNSSGPLMASGAAPTLTPQLFFSRKIGLSGGLAVPIRAGGRVTGRAGPYSVGLLNIETGRTERIDQVSTNFSVARIKRDILRRSSIGVIGTHRSPHPGGSDWNQVFGVDTSLELFENLSINSYYARSHTPGRTGDESSYLGKVGFTTDRYGFNVEHLSVGEAFNPEIGFLRRKSFRRTYGQAQYTPRLRSSRTFRKLYWDASLDYITDPTGQLESREVLGALRVDLNNGDQWSAEFSRNYELLKVPFPIATDVVIPSGGYNFQELRTVYYLGPLRKLMGRLNVTRGSFYNGSRTEAGVSGLLDFGSRLGIEPRLALNWIDLPAGRFTTKLIGARVSIPLTPRMVLASLTQYNAGASSLTANIRFRWEYISGSDLFVVYSEGRDTSLSGGSPVLENRSFVVKVTRLLRF